MARRWSVAGMAGAVLLAGSVSGARAADPVQAAPSASAVSSTPQPGDLVFRAYAEFGPTASIQLINGQAANRAYWKTIVNASLTQPNVAPPQTCTATLVGLGVLLTAAHCLENGSGKAPLTTVWLAVEGQPPLHGDCTLSKEYLAAIANFVGTRYSTRVPQDYALCNITLPAVPPALLATTDAEVVDIKYPLARGADVLMSGFGCTDPAVLKDPTLPLKLDGVLRLGNATVFSASAGDMIVIESALDSAPALCKGDSGGPLISGATLATQSAQRLVRGINSNLVQDAAADGTLIAISSIVPLATSSFADFATTWLANPHNAGRVICGINATAGFTPCRQ